MIRSKEFKKGLKFDKLKNLKAIEWIVIEDYLFIFIYLLKFSHTDDQNKNFSSYLKKSGPVNFTGTKLSQIAA